MFYFTTHSTHFYLRLCGVRHMIKYYSVSKRGNPLPPHGLLFPISSKGSFIFVGVLCLFLVVIFVCLGFCLFVCFIFLMPI